MKKIFTILCSLVLCCTLFAGCNLVQLNKAKFYKTVAVEVEGKEGYKSYNKEYTREEVLNAFYNYSYSNVSNGSVTPEAGLDSAIESMVQRGLLVDYIKANYFDTGILKLTKEDEKTIRYEAFEYMQEQIYTFENEVREEWDRVLTHEHDESEEITEESESLRAEYNPYVSYLEVEYEGQNVVGFINNEIKEDATTKINVPEEFKDFIQITDEDVSSEAYARYVSSLQKVAKSQGKSTKEKDVIDEEVKRLVKTLTENKYISKYQEWFNNNQQFISDDNISKMKESVMHQVLEEYRKEYESQKKLYDLSESAYHKAMGEDSSKVYYHPDYGQGAEYMYVSHILIKFSDSHKATVDALKKDLESKSITQAYYDAKLEELINRTPVTYEEDGKTKTSNAASVYEYVVNYVDTFGGNDPKERAKAFNKMIYMFNDDEGIMNKDFAYVVNLDENVEDKMVKPFADASRELDSNENKGVGSLSEMVVSEYGIHIIFHAGLVTSPDPSGMNSQQLLNALVEQNTQLSSDKTMFHLIYDNITADSADARTQDMINESQGYVVVTIYTKKCKDLLEV